MWKYIDKEEKLEEYFTYENFTLEQKACVTKLMAGRDVMVVFPTGAGKMLCFQILALYFKGLTMMVMPLLSLMQD